MSNLSKWVYTPAAVRELDRIAIEEQGVPGYELMQRAAQFAFAEIVSRYASIERWWIYCGGGNNAGDGYVLARLARAAGKAVTVLAVASPEQLQGDAAQAWRDYASVGGTATSFAGAAAPPDAALIVDALLGTGLTRELTGPYLRAVQQLNAAAGPTVAIDIPTGLCGRTGAIQGEVVCADLTITFVGLKTGLYLGAGPDYTGVVRYSDLAIDDRAAEQVQPELRHAQSTDVLAHAPPRARGGHKGRYGHVLVLGGNTGYGGAVQLAASAALRAGAGLVSVATRSTHVAALLAGRPELMVRGLDDPQGIPDALGDVLTRARVIALGPGLGKDVWAQALYAAALAATVPLVVDADALNLLAAAPEHRDNWVLTPHPGEAARLLGTATASIQSDRLAAARELQARYGGTVLLKGHGTLVVGEAQLPWLITSGNPGMATAGMGDVLTGVIAGLLAQFPAAQRTDLVAVAAYAHGAAGDRAAQAGERGMLASDVSNELRAILNP
jgi:hydroxyethylthiazole kinase-like uncharacterized protein yjeF